MEFGEVLIAMTAILIGGATVMLPVLAITARYVLKPIVESWATVRGAPVAEDRLAMAERRIAMLEEQVQTLERDNSRLLDEADFHMKLRG